jgi:bis(5'-nucleosidyl)-tetraphosphatase
MAKAKMEEWSAGVIIYRRGLSGREYLLLQHREGHWGFPKGHIEDEDLRQAACRELREETGLTSIKLVPGFQGLIEYSFERDGEPIHKRVICFLGQTDRGEVQLSKEHLAFVWLNYDQALKRLTFENSRALLRQAEQFLSGS